MKRKKLHSKSLLAFMFLCIFIMCASVTVSAGTNILPSVKQAKAGTWQRDENGNKYKVFDRITNDLTDITAYYVGWTDNVPPEVEKFGLVHSQHEYYRKNKRHNS